MSSVQETITKNRPKISQSSVRTYSSILNNLYKKISGESETSDPRWFMENQTKILDFLKGMNPRDRKLRLSALVVVSDEDQKVSNKYREHMLKDIQQYNVEIKQQKKTEKQEKAWISSEDIKKLLENLKEQSQYILKKSSGSLTKKEFETFQNYLILSLYVLNPPRRLEYTDMKLHVVDENHNYIKNKKFYFTTYKTSKKYGEQVVPINPKLYYIIRKWKQLNPQREWLLSTWEGNKLTPSMLTQRLNKIFGKNVSVNMLRHIYISENVLKDMPPLEELEETAREMGHSVDTAITQYKKI
jgi:integrase